MTTVDAPGSPGHTRRRSVGRLVKAALSLAIVAALGVWLFRERELFVSALRMSRTDLALISGFTLASWLANVLAQSAVLRALGRPLPLVEVFALHAAGGLLNHLPMRPGTLYRAHYMKRRTGLLYAHFASFTAINALVPLAAAGLVGGVALAVSYDVTTSEALLLLGFFAAMATACLVVLAVPLPRSSSSHRLAKIWNELLVGRTTISAYPGVFVVVTACHAASVAFGASRFFGAYASIDVDLGAAGLLVVGAVQRVSQLLSITPGGLGVQELAVAAAGTVLGVSLAVGVVVASVVRAVAVVWYLVLGGLGLLVLRRTSRYGGDPAGPVTSTE